ncbi:MAG TPA: hypothetical protein DDW85_02325 [Porphyromonadaceae bacterium]|nr:hypothetical protein [Porphyromonadaceae bacterium]
MQDQTQIEYRKVSELSLLSENPRKISRADMDRLVDSIRLNGFWKHRPITLSNRTGKIVVIAGNQRLKAAKKLKIAEVPTILYTDLSEEQEKDIVLRDNINNGEWDFEVLGDDYWGDIDFDFVGLDINIDDEEGKKKGKKKSKAKAGDDSGDDIVPDPKEDFYLSQLNDCLYESNNEFEIPNLLKQKQAGKLLLPFAPWGADSRLRKDVATYHFYVDDYRFEAIWKDPIKVLTSGVRALVEPNLSLFDTTPVAFGLHQIYKKRWISRYFQECGILVYADLNVSVKFREYNKFGIPKGFNAFFTRGYSDRIEYLKIEHQIAKDISGLDTPNLLVYGGGDKVREYCIENSLVYVEQFMQNK